jgi:hypothetical protein
MSFLRVGSILLDVAARANVTSVDTNAPFRVCTSCHHRSIPRDEPFAAVAKRTGERTLRQASPGYCWGAQGIHQRGGAQGRKLCYMVCILQYQSVWHCFRSLEATVLHRRFSAPEAVNTSGIGRDFKEDRSECVHDVQPTRT